MDPVCFKCYCTKNGTTHCHGNLTVTPNIESDKRVFLVSVTDSSGYEYASMWLDLIQLEDLAYELDAMRLKYRKDSENG